MIYTCTQCGTTDDMPTGYGDAAARHRGWRLGITLGGQHTMWCPACSGRAARTEKRSRRGNR